MSEYKIAVLIISKKRMLRARDVEYALGYCFDIDCQAHELERVEDEDDGEEEEPAAEKADS